MFNWGDSTGCFTCCEVPFPFLHSLYTLFALQRLGLTQYCGGGINCIQFCFLFALELIINDNWGEFHSLLCTLVKCVFYVQVCFYRTLETGNPRYQRQKMKRFVLNCLNQCYGKFVMRYMNLFYY